MMEIGTKSFEDKQKTEMQQKDTLRESLRISTRNCGTMTLWNLPILGYIVTFCI